MDVRELCRKFTSCTAVQGEILAHIAVCFSFVADLTHAQVTLYAPVKGKDFEQPCFIVLAHEEPHTAVHAASWAEQGSLVRMLEEPLVRQTFETGKPLTGRREWELGQTDIMMFTYAIHDGNTPMAVVTLETAEETLHLAGSSHLLKTACAMLVNSRKPIEPTLYRPIGASDGVLITDAYNRIIFANEAAGHIYRMLGVGNLLGMHFFDHKLTRHITRETVSPQRPDEKEFEAGNLVLVQRNIPIHEGGKLLCRVIVLEDVTELRKKEKQIRVQSAVIKEIHHRVKNNLQTIASLLRMQARRSSEPAVKEALSESVNRIMSISVVHEFLSQQGFEEIDVKKVTNNILDLLQPMMLPADFVLERKFTGGNALLPPVKGTNLALVINELLLNAMEHGFEGRKSGVIGLDIDEKPKCFLIDIYDDGLGLPQDFELSKTKSLGLQIVRTLVEGDLGGEFRLESDGEGTHARLIVPRGNDKEEKSV